MDDSNTPGEKGSSSEPMVRRYSTRISSHRDTVDRLNPNGLPDISPADYAEMSPHELVARLVSALNDNRDLQYKLALAEMKIGKVIPERTAFQKMATKDALTGVDNRVSFDIKAENAFKLMERYNFRPAEGELPPKKTFVIIDLDGFKPINDAAGHPGGDAALQHVAKFFKKHLREGIDEFARYGGDEFAIIVNANEEETKKLISRLRDRLVTEGFQYGSIAPYLSFSLGVRQLRPADVDRTSGTLESQVANCVDKVFFEEPKTDEKELDAQNKQKEAAYTVINKVLAIDPPLNDQDMLNGDKLKEKLVTAIEAAYEGEQYKFKAFLDAVQKPEIGLSNANPLQTYKTVRDVIKQTDDLSMADKETKEPRRLQYYADRGEIAPPKQERGASHGSAAKPGVAI